MPAPIRLVVGLGNPGPRYAETRHNAGFWFLEALAARLGVAIRPAARFSGEIGECQIEGEQRRLFLPLTFMNRSGRAVASLARFYRYPADQILIAHDDIDLAPGTARLKRGGGHGGHNGLRDIIAEFGDPGFARLRIGVGHPGSSEEVIGYVLSRAPAEQRAAISEAIDRAVEVFPKVLSGEIERAMNLLHRRASQEPRAQRNEADSDG